MATKLEATNIRSLGDGLILRSASPADADQLAEFNSTIHGNDQTGEPDKRVGVWTRDLLTKPHPTFQPADFTVVEDTHTGKIVSSLNLIPQTWSYDGIQFQVGRPELVGTDPDYRNRGLIRAQFELVHQWCLERGFPVQAITGIPYYYRIFGYEMCLNLGGGRAGYLPQIPTLKEGEQEPFQVRPAGQEDLDLIGNLYQRSCQRQLVSVVWDEALWRYEINGRSEQNVNRMVLNIIENTSGEAVGFLAHPIFNWGPSMVAAAYELKPGVSYAAVTPSVIRYLQKTGQAYIAAEGGKEIFSSFGFWHGAEHPVYQVLHNGLPRIRKPYAWYIRIPDLVGFLELIKPVLEKRLEDSPMSGHTGEFKFTFYRDGLRLTLERGRIRFEGWRPEPVGHAGDAAFPGLTFYQLLFGYRTFDELMSIFPDCWMETDSAYALLNILFPKRNSDLWPVS
jgi:GNAT superfamily N-acetyltransferase